MEEYINGQSKINLIFQVKFEENRQIMSINNTIKNISQIMESGDVPAVYDDGEIKVNVCPTKDGWYALRMCDKDGKEYDLDYRLHKSGTHMKVYQRTADKRMLLFRKMNIDIHQNLVMNEGRSELQDEIIKYLVQRCPDVQKIFMEFTPQVMVVKKGKGVVGGGSGKIGGGGGGVYQGNGMLELLEFEGRVILVKGYIQSGKTQFMISSAVWFALQGKHSIIVLRNSEDDKNQLRNRVKDFNTSLQSHLPVHLRGIFNVEAIGNKQIKPRMFEGGPKIFVCIGNAKPLEKINRAMAATKDHVVFVDEVDFVDSLGTKVKEQLDILRGNAYCEFGVSATVMDSALMKEIQTGNLIMLERPQDYFDLASFKRHIIPTKSKYGTIKADDMFAKDPYLATYLEKLATDPISKDAYYSSVHKEWHPRNGLMRVTKTHDSNRRVLAYVAEKYPQVPAMYASGNGSIMLHLPTETAPITLADQRVSRISRVSNDDGTQLFGTYHLFTRTSQSMITQWLHENGGFDSFPRLLTLADGIAARSTSFGGANYEFCKKNNKLWWHLTEMYALVSDSMDQAELQQCLGRLCVVKRDSVDLHLWTTQKVSEDLTKAYWSQEELIERAIHLQKDSHIQKGLKYFLPQVKMFTGKIAKRQMTKKEHVVENEDGVLRPFKVRKVTIAEDLAEPTAWMVEDYTNFDPETAVPFDDIKEELLGEYESTIEQLVAMKKAYDRRGNVYKIIKEFMHQNCEALTVSQLASVCKNGKFSAWTFDKWDLSAHKYYKIVEKTADGKYTLRSEIKDYLNVEEE
jgi:hypothetical protein